MKKKDNPLISVIVPVYNVEKYIRQCIDSILCQTYSNLEIIMVDDGSKDLSGAICDEYVQKYQNCKVIHKENAGLGMARNTGMENMTGDYVSFVDSDDWIAPDLIENLYNALILKGVDMCKGGFQRITDEGKITLVRKYDNQVFEGEEARRELLPRMIGSSPSQHDSIEMCVCGVIYNTLPIKKYTLRFPSERVLISEDMVFNIEYMQYAQGACTISNVGYNYRLNLNSLSTSYRKDRLEACIYFYIEMNKKLEKLGYDKQTLLRLDRMFFVYIRACIKQEIPRISKLKLKESLNNIRKICDDRTVRFAIQRYPINDIGIKQRIFLRMIEYKMSYILYVMAVWNKI